MVLLSMVAQWGGKTRETCQHTAYSRCLTFGCVIAAPAQPTWQEMGAHTGLCEVGSQRVVVHERGRVQRCSLKEGVEVHGFPSAVWNESPQ
jgi:hypothetical protein